MSLAVVPMELTLDLGRRSRAHEMQSEGRINGALRGRCWAISVK